jgi:hypothetical protein
MLASSWTESSRRGQIGKVMAPSDGQLVERPFSSRWATPTSIRKVISYSSVARSRYPHPRWVRRAWKSRFSGASPILAPRRHSSAVEQLFRKSLALCAVLQARVADTNGHTYQLFVSRGCPSRIAATARFALEPTLDTRDRLTSRSSGPSFAPSASLREQDPPYPRGEQISEARADSRTRPPRARDGHTAADSEVLTLRRADNYR